MSRKSPPAVDLEIVESAPSPQVESVGPSDPQFPFESFKIEVVPLHPTHHLSQFKSGAKDFKYEIGV
jgi:hypothetical protein